MSRVFNSLVNSSLVLLVLTMHSAIQSLYYSLNDFVDNLVSLVLDNLVRIVLSMKLLAIIDSFTLFYLAIFVSAKDEWFEFNIVLEFELNFIIRLIDRFTFNLLLR